MGIRNYIQEASKQDRDFSDIIGPMTGAEIGRKLGITRAAVSNTLKRAMGKVYEAFKKQGLSPFEAAVQMMIGLNIEEMEASKFFKLFPPKIRTEIENDARQHMPNKLR